MNTASPRRGQILRVAARLFAAKGYQGVGMDEIGAAVGITGPALYRHFRGKEAMLTELLTGISERLLESGRTLGAAADPGDALDALLRRHIDFALDERELITLHEHALGHVPESERRRIRRLQRAYVEIWVSVVRRAHEGLADEPRARAAVHAVFGLLNSTPYAGHTPRRVLAPLLGAMAKGALSAAAGPSDGA